MAVISQNNESKPISSCSLCSSYPKVSLCTPIGNIEMLHMYWKTSVNISSFFDVGIFWDIENVRLPSYHQAIAVVEAIRRRFLVNYREAEFLVVCDARKERKELVANLNNAQVF